jgi:mannose-6-phosphate isomerase-like protein (cupin superfamily)
MHKVNIIKKLAQFDEYWQPRVVAELNGQYVKLAKFKGAFTWHKHDNEDEMFFVVKGKFRVEFRDKSVELCENEFIVVPKGVEHRSVADEEVEVMLFEPKTTLKTGSAAK